MKEFKIGQVVKIVDKEVARQWAIEDHINMIFIIEKLSSEGNAVSPMNYYIPPEACELIHNVPDSTTETCVKYLQDLCHSRSYDAGWWTDSNGNSTLDNPLTVSNKLMLIVSEIAEAMEGDRKDLMDDKLPHRKAVEVELADAVIRIMDLGGALNLDIGGAMVEKMEYNAVREDHKKESREAAGGKKY